MGWPEQTPLLLRLEPGVERLGAVHRGLQDGIKRKNADRAARSRRQPLYRRVASREGREEAEAVALPRRGRAAALITRRSREVGALLRVADVPVYLRPDELKVLDATGDVDELGQLARITKAWDGKRKRVKAYPKSSAGVRNVPIDPRVMPLVACLWEAGGRGELFPEVPAMSGWSDGLLRHLRAAGLLRAALFEDTASTKHITAYDLRATGITWRTLRRDPIEQIQEHAGHESYETTKGYVCTAHKVGIGEPFPPLPPRLFSEAFVAATVGPLEAFCRALNPRDRDSNRSQFRSHRTQVSETIASPAGFEPASSP